MTYIYIDNKSVNFEMVEWAPSVTGWGWRVISGWTGGGGEVQIDTAAVGCKHWLCGLGNSRKAYQHQAATLKQPII